MLGRCSASENSPAGTIVPARANAAVVGVTFTCIVSWVTAGAFGPAAVVLASRLLSSFSLSARLVLAAPDVLDLWASGPDAFAVAVGPVVDVAPGAAVGAAAGADAGGAID